MRLILVALATTALIGTAFAQPTLQHPPTLQPHAVLTPNSPSVVQRQAVPAMTAPSTTGVGCPGTNDAPGHAGGTGALTNTTGHPGAFGGAPIEGKSGDEPPKDGPHENPHGENPHGSQAMITAGGSGGGVPPIGPGGHPGTFADAPRGNGENPSPPPHGQNSVSPDAPQGQTVGGAHVATGVHLPGGGTINPQAVGVGAGGGENPIGGQRGPGTQLQCPTRAMDGGGGIVPPH